MHSATEQTPLAVSVHLQSGSESDRRHLLPHGLRLRARLPVTRRLPLVLIVPYVPGCIPLLLYRPGCLGCLGLLVSLQGS